MILMSMGLHIILRYGCLISEEYFCFVIKTDVPLNKDVLIEELESDD